jgi:hypothetical protein
MKVTYTPVKKPPKNVEKIEARYKNVVMELYVGDEGVCIDGMESSNPGKGECQEMIVLLREDFQGKELSASPPLSAAAKHIFDKIGVIYAKGKGSILE